MKTQNHPLKREQRPWGSFIVLDENIGFKLKRIEVLPQAALSLQVHQHRNEHWIIVSGMAKVLNGAQEFFLHQNEATYIPAGQRHRLENPTDDTLLVLIEVQTGSYLDEDDIIRFADDYGRC